MVEAAALVHDVGYFISYSGHHKHTYHLVRHADLFGFTPREREIIAQVARYHRKALPKKKHESFARLVAQDRLLVKRLGGNSAAGRRARSPPQLPSDRPRLFPVPLHLYDQTGRGR